MKRYRDLFPRLCTFENLYRAYRRARRGKRDGEAVAAFEYDLEANLISLQPVMVRCGGTGNLKR